MAKAEADMDDIEQHSSYSDEDCHFLPQSLYTRTCENVFKVEDYDATVMPYLKEQFAKFGAGGGEERGRVLLRRPGRRRPGRRRHGRLQDGLVVEPRGQVSAAKGGFERASSRGGRGDGRRGRS